MHNLKVLAVFVLVSSTEIMVFVLIVSVVVVDMFSRLF
jgi:hypothetical protein